MSQRYSPAIDIDDVGIELRLANHSKSLRSKRLVELYELNIGQTQSRPLEHLGYRLDGADPHVIGLHPSHRTLDHAPHGLKLPLF